MGKIKPRGKYQAVSLPTDFLEEIKDHVLQNRRYKSIAEFVRDAVREKMKHNNFLNLQERIGYDVYTKPRTYRGGKRIRLDTKEIIPDVYNIKLNKKPLAFIDAMLLAYETIIVEHGLILETEGNNK